MVPLCVINFFPVQSPLTHENKFHPDPRRLSNSCLVFILSCRELTKIVEQRSQPNSLDFLTKALPLCIFPLRVRHSTESFFTKLFHQCAQVLWLQEHHNLPVMQGTLSIPGQRPDRAPRPPGWPGERACCAAGSTPWSLMVATKGSKSKAGNNKK